MHPRDLGGFLCALPRFVGYTEIEIHFLAVVDDAQTGSPGHTALRNPKYPSCTPFNLHNHRVRRASGFLLTALSNARPNPPFLSALLVRGAPPIKH